MTANTGKKKRVAGSAHDHNAGPWLPIGPFRAWLLELKVVQYDDSLNGMARGIGKHHVQIRRWLYRNKWVPLMMVDEITTQFGHHWLDLYNEGELVSSYNARTPNGIQRKESKDD